LTYSQNLTGASWTTVANTLTANYATSPDGTSNATRIIPNTANSTHINYQTFTVSSATSITAFAKADGYNFFQIYGGDASGGPLRYSVVVNLTTGAIDTIDTITSNQVAIVSMGNGWYKITISNFTSFTSGFSFIGIAGIPSSGLSRNANLDVIFAGNGTGGVLAYGIQVEESSYPTSYIPTTSASATRVADFTSRSGLGLTNFTFSVNFKPLDYIVELFDFQKTGGGRMFYVAVQSSGFITFNSVSGGTIGAIGSIIPKLQTCKLAFKLNASTSDLTVFINGSNIGTYTTNITTFGQFLGLQSFGYNPGTQIEQIAIFPSVLTDAECISLTTI
jgi:hypothetical protein